MKEIDKEEKKFHILIAGDLNYEGLVIDVNFGHEIIAKLSRDEGMDKAKIEIYDLNEYKINWTFDCHSFVKVINEAYKALKEVNEIADSNSQAAVNDLEMFR